MQPVHQHVRQAVRCSLFFLLFDASCVLPLTSQHHRVQPRSDRCCVLWVRDMCCAWFHLVCRVRASLSYVSFCCLFSFSCSNVLCTPTGGLAKLAQGTSFRKKDA